MGKRWPALTMFVLLWLGYWTIEILDFCEDLFWEYVENLLKGKPFEVFLTLILASIFWSIIGFIAYWHTKVYMWHKAGGRF